MGWWLVGWPRKFSARENYEAFALVCKQAGRGRKKSVFYWAIGHKVESFKMELESDFCLVKAIPTLLLAMPGEEQMSSSFRK